MARLVGRTVVKEARPNEWPEGGGCGYLHSPALSFWGFLTPLRFTSIRRVRMPLALGKTFCAEVGTFKTWNMRGRASPVVSNVTEIWSGSRILNLQVEA